MICHPILANSPANPDIVSPGGWRWTSFSPTRSGPEGSSRNEPYSGLCSSLPLKNSSHASEKKAKSPSGVGHANRGAANRQMDDVADSAPEEVPTPEPRPDPATEPGFDLGGAPVAAPDAGYRVLARKYRPTTFDDLVGQEAMVRTLSNAFESGRIAHAFMLTGVRGVGKTTTARILARALNYSKAEGDKPTIELHDFGEHCEAIMESRHQDVLEMDAASRTGIDDIREIIESVRYNPVSARYKVYIIDEVHMLSKAAFNGLLKTLEEPPEHVKFIFATTEVNKVPITVLSRCQRFDLKRINAGQLAALFADIIAKEGVEAEQEALALIAHAA